MIADTRHTRGQIDPFSFRTADYMVVVGESDRPHKWHVVSCHVTPAGRLATVVEGEFMALPVAIAAAYELQRALDYIRQCGLEPADEPAPAGTGRPPTSTPPVSENRLN